MNDETNHSANQNVINPIGFLYDILTNPEYGANLTEPIAPLEEWTNASSNLEKSPTCRRFSGMPCAFDEPITEDNVKHPYAMLIVKCK